MTNVKRKVSFKLNQNSYSESQISRPSNLFLMGDRTLSISTTSFYLIRPPLLKFRHSLQKIQQEDNQRGVKNNNMPLPDPFGFVFDFFEKKEEPKSPKNAEEENKRPPFVINTLTDSHEQLRTHKPGDIVYDERRQKWYRVKKSTLPGYLTYGPKNIGDPDDTFLRKIEKNVLLPDMMAKKIEKVDCRTDFMEFIRCMRREGEYESVQSCQPFFDKFYGCKLEKFRCPEFRERVTQEFLRDRSEYRKTGLSRNEREMEKYLKWKEDMLKEKLRQQGKEAPD